MDITIRNLQKRIPISPRRINQAVRTILRHEKVKDAALSIVFVSDPLIASLNQKYLKRKYATDVLAFDLSEFKASLKNQKNISGEIVISADTVARNSEMFETSRQKELLLCVIHGILHLLGFDDHGKENTLRMRRREAKLLRLFYS